MERADINRDVVLGIPQELICCNCLSPLLMHIKSLLSNMYKKLLMLIELIYPIYAQKIWRIFHLFYQLTLIIIFGILIGLIETNSTGSIVIFIFIMLTALAKIGIFIALFLHKPISESEIQRELGEGANTNGSNYIPPNLIYFRRFSTQRGLFGPYIAICIVQYVAIIFGILVSKDEYIILIVVVVVFILLLLCDIYLPLLPAVFVCLGMLILGIISSPFFILEHCLRKRYRNQSPNIPREDNININNPHIPDDPHLSRRTFGDMVNMNNRDNEHEGPEVIQQIPPLPRPIPAQLFYPHAEVVIPPPMSFHPRGAPSPFQHILPPLPPLQRNTLGRRDMEEYIRINAGIYNAMSTEGGSCSICMELLHTGQSIVMLTCPATHIFHYHCIHQWFITHKTTCPNCRTNLF